MRPRSNAGDANERSQVPPFADAQAMALLRRDLGVADLSEVFEDLTPGPIASASIGQVYKGRLKPGASRDRVEILGDAKPVWRIFP